MNLGFLNIRYIFSSSILNNKQYLFSKLKEKYLKIVEQIMKLPNILNVFRKYSRLQKAARARARERKISDMSRILIASKIPYIYYLYALMYLNV